MGVPKMGCGASSINSSDPRVIAQKAGAIWKRIDTDKSGHLTKAELLDIFDNDEEISQRLISQIDVGEDGDITETEWKSYWQKQVQKPDADAGLWIDAVDKKCKAKKKAAQKEKKEKKRKRLTEMGIDRDKDGVITKEELRAALEKKHGKALDDQLVDDMYATLDKDKDGKLTMEDMGGLS